MELKQLELGDKVKVRFKQPDIICSGRKRIEGYFKGVVVTIGVHFTTIDFNPKQVAGKRFAHYHRKLGKFAHKVHQDLEIYKITKAQ